MLIAFQIILLIIIVIGFIVALGEKEDKHLRDRMVALCITSILAFLIGVVWL